MFLTQEVINAEMNYRLELARDAARRAQVRRPSPLHRLLARVPRTGPRMIMRGGPRSA